jgi:hypothetical protein
VQGHRKKAGVKIIDSLQRFRLFCLDEKDLSLTLTSLRASATATVTFY